MQELLSNVIKGIDVSHWQGTIDWHKVAADGVKFVFIKCTEGTYFFDPSFIEYAKGAKAAGIALGTYHYGKFSNVAEAQAEAHFFLNKISGITFEYPIVLDLEENNKGVSKAELTDAAVVFLQEIEKAGYFPILYTGMYFLQYSLDEAMLTPFAKWIARYSTSLGRSADIWQYSDTGKVSGINGNVDMNWSYRDFATSKVVMCNIVINGRNLDRKGFIRNHFSYLPVRAVGNAVGVEVGFKNGKASLGSKTLETTIIDNRSGYAQAREIGTALGYLVEWDGVTKTVKLTIKK